MKEIQIYEVENTNLLFVVTDRNSDASYYSKSNLTVEAVDGYVVMWNEGVQFFRELPRDFVTPLESSVVDLVEIIQGYINNILPIANEELDVLKELSEGNKERNELLEAIKNNTSYQIVIVEALHEQTKYLRKIYNPE